MPPPPELLYFYLESEVKHGRLAMLGALGWIGAELANPGMRAPNVLNGHIFEPINFLGAVRRERVRREEAREEGRGGGVMDVLGILGLFKY